MPRKWLYWFQTWWSKNIGSHDFFKNNIKFDIDSKIILNLVPYNLFTNKTSFALTDGKVVINNNNPNLVHGPGNTDLNFILESYGYEDEIIEIRKNYTINGFPTYLQKTSKRVFSVYEGSCF